MSDINAGSVSVEVVPDARLFAEKLRARLGNLAVTVRADADTKAAEAKLDEVARNRTSRVDVDTRDAGRNISALTTAIVGLGPALVPVTAAAAGLAGALGAPLVAAGGGLTVFGLIAGKAVSDTNKVAKQIDELRTKAASLTDPKAQTAALKQAKTLEASLTGPQKAFINAKDAMSSAFTDLTKKVGPAIFAPIVKGMTALAKLLPTAAPLLRHVSSALSDVVDSIARSAQSGALKGFTDFIAQASGPAIRSFATILGNIASGAAGLIEAFQPLAGSVLGGLERMSRSFANFGQSAGTNSGFQGFLNYVRENGPLVASTIGALVRAGGNLVRALAPLGHIALGGLRVLANAVAAIPPTVLGSIASGIAAIVVGVKVWSVAQAALNAVLDANPIGIVVVALGALAAGLVYAYKHSATFRNAVNGAFHAVADAGRWMWNNVLQPTFHALVAGIATIIQGFANMAKAGSHLPGPLGDAFGRVAKALQNAADKANGMADAIRKIPDHAATTVRVNGVAAAIAATQSYIDMMRRLNGSVARTYIEQIKTHGPVAGGGHPVATRASGGYISGPGTATSDSIPAYLSNGEYVVKAAAVAKYGVAMFDRLNAMHFADGGSTTMTAAQRKAHQQALAAAARRRRLSLRSADNSFDLYGGLSVQRVNSELASFALAVHRIGDHLGKSFSALGDRARRAASAYLRSEAAVKKETAARDALVQARDSAVSSAQGAFTSDAFSGSLSTMDILLGRDTSNASAFNAALKAAQAHGLSGALGQGLAASGNLRLAQQFASLTPAQIRAQEKLFAQHQLALNAVGATTGSFFAPQIAHDNRVIAREEATLKRLDQTMNHLEKAIEKGVFRKQEFHIKSDHPSKIAKEVARREKHAGRA